MYYSRFSHFDSPIPQFSFGLPGYQVNYRYIQQIFFGNEIESTDWRIMKTEYMLYDTSPAYLGSCGGGKQERKVHAG